MPNQYFAPPSDQAPLTIIRYGVLRLKRDTRFPPVSLCVVIFPEPHHTGTIQVVVRNIYAGRGYHLMLRLNRIYPAHERQSQPQNKHYVNRKKWNSCCLTTDKGLHIIHTHWSSLQKGGLDFKWALNNVYFVCVMWTKEADITKRHNSAISLFFVC